MLDIPYRVPPPLSDEPLVSIFLFCRNGAPTIRRSVESVLSQPYRNIELVVQDGLSTDNTLSIIQEYRDERVHIVSEKDSGPQEGMVRAMRRCRGEIIGSCLSDEELLPNAIADAVAYFRRNPEAAALHRDVFYTGLDGHPTHMDEGRPYSLLDYLAWETVIHFVTSFFNTAALHDIGLLTREWADDCSELEFWTRLGDKYRIDYVPGVNAKYAAGHSHQLSNSAALRVSMVKGCARMVRSFYKESEFLQGEEALRNYCASANLKSVSDLLRDDPASSATIAELARYCHQEMGLGQEIKSTTDLCRKLRRAGKSTLAINLCQQLIQSEPANGEAYLLFAGMLAERGMIDVALQIWEKALNREDFPRYLEASVRSPRLAAFQLKERQQQWAAELEPLSLPAWIPPAPAIAAASRLRIGVHAARWRNEAAQRQIIPVLRNIDSTRFELICYGDVDASIELPGAWLAPTSHLSDSDFAAIARSHALDILIETSDLTSGHRWGALAARCAPIQAAYLGHFSTSGVPNVDYLFGDAITFPPGEESFATEKIVRLPGCFTCFDFGPERKSEPAWTQNGFITFGCLEQGALLNQEVIDLWISLLNMLPQSRLLLCNEEIYQVDIHVYLRAQFEKYRIARSRLLAFPRRGETLALNLHDQIDIALDPFPHNGLLGIAAALARGVPVVTLRGHRFASRLGASLLTAAGLPDLIAETPRDYLAKAAALAADPLRLLRLREELPARTRAHGLTDASVFARKWEDTLSSMAGLRP